jgi:hypothetical protein
MARFDVTDLCDLVRGVADPEAERRMRARLAAGDADARRIVDGLSRVAAVARADGEDSPPAYAVRLAKAAACIGRPREEVRRSSLWKYLPFEVVFDNLREPALAGTRDLQMPFRQMSFKAEGYSVDLRWDQDAPPRTTVLVGQVLERPEAGGPRPAARIPVLVTSAGGELAGHSVTSELGEFQAAGLPEGDLELHVLVGPETCLRLPLDQAAVD